MSDKEFEDLMKDWQVCYSKRKKRDYYFNSKTGESLWSLDEVKQRVGEALMQKKSDSKAATFKFAKQKSQLDEPNTSADKETKLGYIF